MKESRKKLICAAFLFAAMLCGCNRDGGKPDWEETLPLPASETSAPTVSYDTTESTTTTPEIIITTTERTKRTAATESSNELATTTSGTPTEPTLPTDISNVPISEFTSSTAFDPNTAMSLVSESKPAEEQSAETDSSKNTSVTSGKTSDTGILEGDKTSSAVTELDSLSNVYSADEIQRPYSYNQLTDKQVYIYDAVISAVERLRTDITFSSVMSITSEDYCDVYQQIYNDEHALFYIDTKMQYAVNTSSGKLASSIVFYKYSEEKIREMQKEIEAEAKKILDKVTSDMTEYDKVKLFYDELAENVVYDESEENCRDIYGVLVKKRAICGGYSKAFSYLCDKVGIETVTVTGDADGEAHMWNMVKINGEWYNIDVTYAVTESDAGSYVRYDYFCVTDEMLADTRDIYEQTYTYPKATAEECNYYVKNGLIADSWDDARAMFINQIGEATKNKETVLQVKCSSKEVYDKVISELFDARNKQAIKIFEEALPDAAYPYNCTSISYAQDSTSMVVKLFLEYTD